MPLPLLPLPLSAAAAAGDGTFATAPPPRAGAFGALTAAPPLSAAPLFSGNTNSETGHSVPALMDSVTQCGCTILHVFSSCALPTFASVVPPWLFGGTSKCVHCGVNFREKSPPFDTTNAQIFCLFCFRFFGVEGKTCGGGGRGGCGRGGK